MLHAWGRLPRPSTHVDLRKPRRCYLVKQNHPITSTAPLTPGAHLSSNYQPVFSLSSGNARPDLRDIKGLQSSKSPPEIFTGHLKMEPLKETYSSSVHGS